MIATKAPGSDRKYQVRAYQPSDRDAIRAICCDTGFLGNPIDPVFEDRELFADYLTRYYTDWEPESAFVVVRDGQVRGYLIGCRQVARQRWFELWHTPWLALRGAVRWLSWPYNEATRRYIRWALTQAAGEVPEAPADLPHFHFNILPDARGVGETHDLIEMFLAKLRAAGDRAVYGQVVVFEERRSERLFQRFGFEVVAKGEITKFLAIRPEPVFLFTVVKDLSRSATLYQASKTSGARGNGTPVGGRPGP